MRFNHPILVYLTISFISLLCAAALFLIGKSIANITGTQASIIGLSYEAGGGIIGFIMVFILSRRTVILLYNKISTINSVTDIKVYLVGNPNNFERDDSSYRAECTIFNEESGKLKSVRTKPFWDAGYLAVKINNINEKDYIKVLIKNSSGVEWTSESFHSKSLIVAGLNKIN